MRTPRPRPRLEKFEQADGVKLLRLLGAAVYVSGTVRRSGDYQGTMQTPGIPDVHAFLSGHILLVWEVKRARGKMSPAQVAYRDHCRAAGIAHVVGPLTALVDWLTAEGYLSATRPRVSTRRE